MCYPSVAGQGGISEETSRSLNKRGATRCGCCCCCCCSIDLSRSRIRLLVHHCRCNAGRALISDYRCDIYVWCCESTRWRTRHARNHKLKKNNKLSGTLDRHEVRHTRLCNWLRATLFPFPLARNNPLATATFDHGNNRWRKAQSSGKGGSKFEGVINGLIYSIESRFKSIR